MARNTVSTAGSGKAEIRVLGPVEVCLDGVSVDVGHARQRVVLAILASRVGVVTPTAQLIEQLWQAKPPKRARDTLYSYLSRLRKTFAAANVSLERRPGGYVLDAEPATVDMCRFRELVSRARGTGAIDDWDEALALWRGEPFADLDIPMLDKLRTTLDAEHFAAVLDRNEALLDHGAHTRLLPELRDLAERFPWDERLAGQFMLALDRCGRPSEARDHYRKLSNRLVSERGTTPGGELTRLHRELLAARPRVRPAAGPDGSSGSGESAVMVPSGEIKAANAGRSTVVPRQLPDDVAGFCGRTVQLRQLTSLLTSRAGTVVVSAITGTAGIGKTALAVHWAHTVAEYFPDGQLYVNLRGFDASGKTVNSGEAVRGFLDALGVPVKRLPSGSDAQAALFRSLVAERKMLVVLDNARDAEQVRPLLPGGRQCLTLVTSRNALTGLVASEGATPLVLDTMPTADCRALLRNRLGGKRISDFPATDELIEACARLPLALTIVASRAATDPGLPLATLTARLCREQSTLDCLDVGGALPNLRAVFSWSYRALSTGAAAMFRKLGLHPRGELSPSAAASLAGVGREAAVTAMDELVSSNMVSEPGWQRYSLHDLLREYARELAEAHETEAGRNAAERRLLDWHIHGADNAAQRLNSSRARATTAEPLAWVTVDPVADGEDARRWFTMERPGLVAMSSLARARGWDVPMVQLAWAAAGYLDWQGLWAEGEIIQSAAVDAARRLNSRHDLSRACRTLARAYGYQGKFHQAHACLAEALALFNEASDPLEQAHTHLSFARLYDHQGQYEKELWHSFRGLELHRAAGNDNGAAIALNNIGWAAAHNDDLDTALSACEEALRIHTRDNRELNRAGALNSLGYVHMRRKEYPRAIAYLEQSMTLFEGLGHRHSVAETLVMLADALGENGGKARERDCYEKALCILDELSHFDADDVRAKLQKLDTDTAV